MSLSDTWTKFVANEADIWVEFHRFWMRKRFECPILIVRYEDIMTDKEVIQALRSLLTCAIIQFDFAE